MAQKILILLIFMVSLIQCQAQLISKTSSTIDLSAATIVVDNNDFALVKKAADLLQKDIEAVTGKKIPIQQQLNKAGKNNIIIGSIANSSFIRSIYTPANKSTQQIENTWEAYQIKTLKDNLIVAGNDRRGVAFGVFELSKQIGISPWYWWADVPVKKQSHIYINTGITITDSPKVKYRGIFINAEAPALSNWSKEKFGGFNHQFYEKVFELMLRLKSNYLWPAMWGNAFYDDDSLNIKSADEYGIVIGTSHHEPLMRAHDEWRRYGNKQKWNYDSTETGLKEFWRQGMHRATNEKIVTVGMRGDGDEPMSRETATALLERIVKDQRQIIATETGKPASQTPQLWALYKEVQGYYEKGMRVPDDVTLLLCDDNWGNIRKLPGLKEKKRSGGYGIYYHFDYVGAPRNYKWLNTNSLPRIWEQMHLAWQYNARQIWIVNVGDIKPMEFPISFFLDYAWNPEKIDADNIQQYTERWAATQFGDKNAKDIANLLSSYTKYNARCKPELLNADTYSLNYREWDKVVTGYNSLLLKAEKINNLLLVIYRNSFFELVLHPIKACANLNEMYYTVALNKQAYNNKWKSTNRYADKVMRLYKNDSLITVAYHSINGGKWNHMMSQTHIGYTYWQQPEIQVMPAVWRLSADSISDQIVKNTPLVKRAKIPTSVKGNIFYEEAGLGVSIEAAHFTHAVNSNGISWKVLPDLGKTGSAITTFPVTASEQKLALHSPHADYIFYTFSKGDFMINAYFSPTLNFSNNKDGLQYAISVDGETPQIISINKNDEINDASAWNKWVANNIIIKSTKHNISQPGRHTLKYWMVDAGIVLQKLVIDFGQLKQSTLGAPETIRHQLQ